MKLNSIEKRVLQYVIENGNGTNAVCIRIPEIETIYLIQAVESLHNMGLVIKCNDTCNANAFLTQKGLCYFDDLERAEYGDLYDIISTIDKIIKKAQDLKSCQDGEKIKTFIRQSFIPYSDCLNKDTIHGFKTTFGLYAKEDLQNYHNDLDYLIIIFTKIKNDKKYGAKSLQVEKIKIENKIVNENKNIVDISINLSQVYNQITESKELTNDEKIELQQLIKEALSERDKPTLWEKIKNIFGKVANKTFDVAVSVLPILTEAMLKAKGLL